MRIYELAKQLGVTNKELLAKLPDLGIAAKSHASSLNPEQARAVAAVFKPELLEKARADIPDAPVPKKPTVKAKEEPKPAAKQEKSDGPPKVVSKKVAKKIRAQAKADRRAAIEQDRIEEAEAAAAAPPKITVREGTTVKELAEKLNVNPSVLIQTFMNAGAMVSLNQRVDLELAELAADEHGFVLEKEQLYKSDELDKADEKGKYEEIVRPPVVTVMGHVDHGKTALLDYIRKANVVAGEAGGITQHIGAYTVESDTGKVTFIDTPGHAAFTAMRARGASVTDIVILVVAADDGVMPQTEEAIHHAQAANVPIIVAINKCDLPAANADRVRKELADRNLVPEDWGGETIMVEVSAITGENIDKLLELLTLQSEMLELKAAPDAPARGVIIEAQLDKAMGPLGTVLVRQGTLRVGDAFVCGNASAKVRALITSTGDRIKEAPPSTAVAVLGFNELPTVGDILQETKDEKEARAIAEERADLTRADRLQQTGQKPTTLEELQATLKGDKAEELCLVVKGDTVGSVEAIRDALEKISDERVNLRVLHGAVGAISETDINLAAASNAIVVGFNIRAMGAADAEAKRQGVEIRYYSIIYKLIEDITKALEGLLQPELKETVTGHAEVRETFRVKGAGMIAGCYITDGTIRRNSGARVLRDGTVIYQSKIASLRRFKEDVRDVGVNFECGIGVENFNDVKVGDVIEAFTVTEEAQSLKV